MRSAVVDAIIYVIDEDLKLTLREEMRKKEISNILTPMTLDECMDLLDRFPQGLFIVDWAVGNKTISRSLEAARPKDRGNIRPILLIASEIALNVVATAAEYGVSQIHTGDQTRQKLAASLGNIIRVESSISEFKDSLSQAIRARVKGKTDLALSILKRLAKSNPDNLRIKAELAEVYFQDDMLDQALTMLKGMEDQDPPYLRGVHLMGRCLMKKGEYDSAVKIMEKAALLNPHNVDRLVDLGYALLQLDRVEDAKQHFDAALEIEGSNRSAIVGKGQCLLMEGDVNEGLGLLQEVTSGPELASVFNLAAIMSMRNQRFESGMDLYQAALKALGNDERIYARLMFNMGIGFMRWRKASHALACFEKATKLDPTFEKAKTRALQGKDESREDLRDEEISYLDMDVRV